MCIKSVTFFCLFFLCSCYNIWEKDTVNYKFTGVVVDQVTKNPIEGVTIYLGETGCDVGDNISRIGPTASSDANGNYKLVFSESFFDEGLGCKYIYATKHGYMGSNIFRVFKGGLTENNFELYHPSTLNLTVKNDTANNQVDEAKLYFYCDYKFNGYPGVFGSIGFAGAPTVVKTIRGREFDSTFVFDQLWGNTEYIISLAQMIDQYPGTRLISSYKITCKPDSASYLVVTF